MNHQAQLAERRRLQQQSAVQRAHTVIAREADRSRLQSERAVATAQRSSAADQKAADKAVAQAHRESRVADVAPVSPTCILPPPRSARCSTAARACGVARPTLAMRLILPLEAARE